MAVIWERMLPRKLQLHARAASSASSSGPQATSRALSRRAAKLKVPRRFWSNVQTNRPQKPAVPLLSREMVAILFSSDDKHPPIVVVLRPGFPRTSHQFWNPEGVPPSLCVDDRPWPEARITWTPAETLQRLVRWFERAGMGELHAAGQPLDPYFAGATLQIVLPKAIFVAADEKTDIVAHIRDGQSNVAVATLHCADVPERAGLAISFICYAPKPLPMADSEAFRARSDRWRTR